jgi:hypothetical protein
VPSKTVSRKTRFNTSNPRPPRPDQVTRQTRFAKNPALSAEQQRLIAGIGIPMPATRTSTRRWATGQNVKAANRTGRRRGRLGGGQDQAATSRSDIAGGGISTHERIRRAMVVERNRRRRYPWIPAIGAIGVGLIAYVLGSLFAWATNVTAESVALVLASAPLAAAAVVALRHRRTHSRWLPELMVAGAGSAAVVYWVGVAGLSWWTVLVVLVGTIAGGVRWWRAHPIGPGVPRLQPPGSTPEPEPESDTGASAAKPVPPPETDPYCIAWNDNNARDGKAKGSRLTNRRADEWTITYDVELKRGQQTVKDLLANRAPLASGLGEDTERVLFKRAPRGSGAHMAVLSIITKDPVAEPRFYTGPRVEDGLIKDPARFIDGSGEIDITMWDDDGTVATMVVGSPGGGKSGAANILVCGAMSTGVMNLLYADPKGNSSTALASRARVAIIGKENVLKLPYLVIPMLKARGDLAGQLGDDQLFPSAQYPSWMVLHDEYSLVANDPLPRRVWAETANIVRSLAWWMVFLNQSQSEVQWGGDPTRAAFAGQVIAFRVNSKSSSDLVPGLAFDPNELPVADRGRPVAGTAVHAHYDTPTRWDFLPSESNAARMAEKGEPAPPYTTTTAFDAFFNQPQPHPMDIAAIESVLGPAVNGRWQVGGPGATHRFPDMEQLTTGTSSVPAAKPKGRWGQRGKTSGGQLTPVETEVLAIVRGGTAKAADIVDACKASRSSVFEALDTLTGLGLICKTSHGNYEPIKQDA